MRETLGWCVCVWGVLVGGGLVCVCVGWGALATIRSQRMNTVKESSAAPSV